LLDLSAAFDTIDHKTLLDVTRQQNYTGIQGQGLRRFISYQIVTILSLGKYLK